MTSGPTGLTSLMSLGEHTWGCQLLTTVNKDTVIVAPRFSLWWLFYVRVCGEARHHGVENVVEEISHFVVTRKQRMGREETRSQISFKGILCSHLTFFN